VAEVGGGGGRGGGEGGNSARDEVQKRCMKEEEEDEEDDDGNDESIFVGLIFGWTAEIRVATSMRRASAAGGGASVSSSADKSTALPPLERILSLSLVFSLTHFHMFTCMRSLSFFLGCSVGHFSKRTRGKLLQIKVAQGANGHFSSCLLA
jgi:hypothetical protein